LSLVIIRYRVVYCDKGLEDLGNFCALSRSSHFPSCNVEWSPDRQIGAGLVHGATGQSGRRQTFGTARHQVGPRSSARYAETLGKKIQTPIVPAARAVIPNGEESGTKSPPNRRSRCMALPRAAIEMRACTRRRFQSVRLPLLKRHCKDFPKKKC